MTVQKLRIGNEDVDIGDENLPYMSPYVKIRRWGGAFGFGLDIPLPSGLNAQGESFFAETNEFGFEFKPTPSNPLYNEMGGLDFIITVKSKPPDNKITFRYDAQDVVAYHQPVITAPDIVNDRPDYCINSVCLYHSYKRNNEQKTSKAQGS